MFFWGDHPKKPLRSRECTQNDKKGKISKKSAAPKKKKRQTNRSFTSAIVIILSHAPARKPSIAKTSGSVQAFALGRYVVTRKTSQLRQVNKQRVPSERPPEKKKEAAQKVHCSSCLQGQQTVFILRFQVCIVRAVAHKCVAKHWTYTNRRTAR